MEAEHKSRGKTIEQQYQKKSQLEHILLRPDTYVGAIEHHETQTWIWDVANEKMVYKKVNYVPGLYKIFDEILVNAADNKQRDFNMKNLKVVIDKENSMISVYNDGMGIPVEIHKEHQCYVPEMIFGQLLTGDNYDDSEKRVTGGRNGYGAKLTNIFSNKFMVECGDHKRKRKFKMTWTNNMGKKSEPSISSYDDKDFTKISFWPDLKRFQMDCLDDDILGLMYKRVYDMAGSSDKSLKVFLNGTKLPVNEFKDYVDLYLKEKEEHDKLPRIVEKCDRWEAVITLSDGTFNQCSFVNSICTTKGGTHVAHVVDQVVAAVQGKVCKKNKGGMEIKPNHIKSHLWVFVNALIENPSFDSQTKETLTTKPTKFGSKCSLSDKTIKAVLNMGIQELVLNWASIKQEAALARKLKGGGANKTSRLTGIPKLEDANDAGTRHSEHCTLILTEGDSAKTSCIAGLHVVGRDKFGVFPLKGKLLNVRDANHKQLLQNQEIQNIMKIVGLDISKKIDNPKSLRYGSIMIMTDQDLDGSHIKGLLINFLHHYWPSLLKYKGFLKEFITPIVKVWKKKDLINFYTMPEYEKWKETHADGKGWEIKYYKGLGTSTDKEFMSYFGDINKHQISFDWESNEDDEAIDMAFSSKRADDRKFWINSYDEGDYVNHDEKLLRYYNFVHKELVQFSRYDLERSVPSVVDGLKPSQRKVLFGCLKRKLVKDVKVAQLVGYISEVSAYHHGEKSLCDTVVNMAQTFVGANNVNLLEPSGQFGSRKEGGKDCASARYVYTRLSPVTRLMFHEDDDPLLHYFCEEGQWIEPKWYIPIIPQVLVNGAQGIGTGWSTSIPNYNPRDVILNLKRYLRRQEMEEMTPFFRWFEGDIVKNAKGGFESIGKYRKIDSETLEITELPIRAWTSPYREYLEELMTGKEKDKEKEPFIKDFRDNSAHHTVSFTITMSAAKMAEAEKEGIDKKFKLRSAINTSNMTLFGPDGRIYRYNNPLDILKEFGNVRIEYYRKRKEYLLGRLERERDTLDNKARFVLMVIKNELIVNNKKKKVLLQELKALKFKTISELKKGEKSCPSMSEEKAKAEGAPEEEEEVVAPGELKTSDYDYLVGMPLWNLTEEKVQELLKQLEEKKRQIDELRATPPEVLWDRNLDALMNAIAEADQRYWLEMNDLSHGKSSKGGKAKAKAKGGKMKRKAWSDSDDDASSDSYKPASKKTKMEKDDPWGSGKKKGSLFNRIKKEEGSPLKSPGKSAVPNLDMTEFEMINKQPILKTSDEDVAFMDINKFSWTEETKMQHMVKKEKEEAAKAEKLAKRAPKKTASTVSSIVSSLKSEAKGAKQTKLKLEKKVKDEWHSSDDESDEEIDPSPSPKRERSTRTAAVNAQKKLENVTTISESNDTSEHSDSSSIASKKPKAKAKGLAKRTSSTAESVDPLELLGWGAKRSSPRKKAEPKKRTLKKKSSDVEMIDDETPIKKGRAKKIISESSEDDYGSAYSGSD